MELLRSWEEYGDDCDYVLSRAENDPTGSLQCRRVEAWFVHTAAVGYLHAGGQVIGTTGQHRFYAWGRAWVPAAELLPGDLLLSHDGQWVEFEGYEETGEFAPVYNCRVEGAHTYFVSGEDWGFSVWAHNTCDMSKGLDWDAVVPQKGKYKGEKRVDHVRRHNVDNPTKDIHGVFYGDGVAVTNEAWGRARTLGLQPDAQGYLRVPMERIIGREGGKAVASGSGGALYRHVHIHVVPNTNNIITAYPGL